MTPTDAQLRDLLLRRLPPAETDTLEAAIILDEGVAERLLAAQFDLIDDYAAGRLAAAERVDVERHLLSAMDNVHSLRVARGLSEEKSSRRLPAAGRLRPSTSRYARMGALLAAGVLAVVVIPQWDRLPFSTPPATVATAKPPSEEPAAVAPGEAAVVILRADVERGAEAPLLKWNAGVSSIRLQAEVPRPEPGMPYRLTIDDAAGHRLFETRGLAVNTAGGYHFVESILPARALGPGARTIALRVADGRAGAPAAFTWQVVGAPD